MSEAVERLFERLRGGDDSALGELTPTLYRELHRIAAHHMRGERPDHTLQPTALVHEAYLKLFEGASRLFMDRVHFLSVASRVMRQVLVDYARSRASIKRSRPPSLEVKAEDGRDLIDLIELDDAIRELAKESEPIARLIEMRYFGGMTAEETAEVLGESVHVVRHDLRYGHAWLRRKLT
jgi:RNA polymerase sigma factor (TIGR02999 family)